MRQEVREYMRTGITLLDLAPKDGALTGAECDAIVSLAQDLETKFGSSRQQSDAVGGAQLLRALIDEIPTP
jgi:hypothetical protein